MSADNFALVAEYATPAVVPLSPKTEKASKSLREPKPRRNLTADEAIIIPLLAGVSYTPASFDKRFAREIQGVAQITEGQSQQAWRIFKRYRKQIKHPEKDRLLAIAATLEADLRTK